MQELIDTHKNLSLPKFPEDDGFSDWMTELIEVDWYYVSLSMSSICRAQFHIISTEALQELMDSFEKFSEIEGEDAAIYLYCKKYLLSLKTLVDEMVQFPIQ